ncbi:hypothetical protein [uncultured Demequina sp.]|uniref:hypothetical protein n=1 Tax=uncultured Demequina sp. TaxID=693499 RepID=UPI0025F38585|nr:hypothetical protein [uncultured Demequina sp.]
MSAAVEEPTCAAHPYGYHRRSRVSQRPDRVLVEPGFVGLPARCITLERELEEADRVDDFVRQLWVVERQGRGGLSVLLVAFAAIVMMVLAAVAGDVQWGSGLATGVVGVAVLGVAGEAAVLRAHRARLRRVYEWRQYVGFQA